jgi:major membrane immunogen (membrane-anchored lipoprotein)
MAAEIDRNFWDEARGLYADDLEHKFFSEHTQCFALLSDRLPQDKRPRVIDGLIGATHASPAFAQTA